MSALASQSGFSFGLTGDGAYCAVLRHISLALSDVVWIRQIVCTALLISMNLVLIFLGLVVEDAPAGITAGKRAGAKVLGVLTSHSYESVKSAEPDWIVPDLTQSVDPPSR